MPNINFEQNRITPRQLGILLILCILGDSTIFLNTPNDPQHCWLAYIFSGIGGFIILTIYLCIYKLNNLKPLTVILNNCFGKYMGSVLSLLYSLFFICNASAVLYNYTAYTIQTSFDYTPKWFIILYLVLIVLYVLFKGIKVIARTSEIFLWVIFFTYIFVWVVQMNDIKADNLYPVHVTDYFLVIRDAFYPFLLKFGGIITFLMLFPLAGSVKSIKQPLFAGMGIIMGILVLVFLRTLLIMGGSMINRYVYPTYFSYSISEQIKMGIIPASAISLSVLIKALLFLYSSITIIASVFNMKKIRLLIIGIVIATSVLSYFVFDTGIAILEFFENIWVYFITMFAVIIPIMILIISLIINLRNHEKLKHAIDMK